MNDQIEDVVVDTSAWLADGEFPTRQNCNPNNSEEAFLWMYAGLPGMRGAPLTFPIEYLRQVSRRQWDCGARPVDSVIPGEVLIKYQRPKVGDPHWLTNPGVWVDQAEPDRDQFDIKEFVGSLPQDAKRQLAEALGFDPATAVPDRELVDAYAPPALPRTGPPAVDGASVINEPLPFDPVHHGVSEVLAYLRNADEDERGRVLDIERHLGNARRGILKRYEKA